MKTTVSSIEAELRRYKALGGSAFGQLREDDLAYTRSPVENSVAVLVWHVAGNLKSRFTDFLTSDGEKPWRKRDTEFEARRVTHTELKKKWEDGWDTLFETLEGLSDSDLTRTVKIRGQELTVLEALHRSLAHASYHVGQIVFLAKALRKDSWNFLSIPPGKSETYNRDPTLEKVNQPGNESDSR